jgi:tetratricopeptide (TPR) repeat protein
VPLITALEKIALSAGGTRNVRSWRHHSVAERVRFLSRVGFDADAREEYRAQARRFTRGFTAVIALLAALTAWRELGREFIVLRTAIALNPHNIDARTQLGYAYLERDRLRSAEQQFQEAFHLDEHWDPKPCAGLAELYLAEGALRDPDKAIVWARRAVEREERRAAPAHQLAGRLRLLARAYAGRKLYEEAVSSGERAQAMHPDPGFAEELERFRRGAQEERIRIDREGSA